MADTFLKDLKVTTNYTETENGAVALNSTLNSCLDAFGSLGAMKDVDENRIIRLFSLAFAEDRVTAMRILFYIRDIRGGQGMRRVFRVIIKWLAETEPDYVINNLDNFLEYGRADDMLCLLDTSIKHEVADWIVTQLGLDYIAYWERGPISLLAKWLPSENASSPVTKRYARTLCKLMGCKPAIYRQLLSILRSYSNVVECKMSANTWTDIKYDQLPAKASMLYGNAFYKHDEVGYTDYIKKLATGNAKVNAASLFPVDIVNKAKAYNISHKDTILLDAMWKALPNYVADQEETGICIVDVSGSMTGTPMDVAISLGAYLADKCRGPFQNHFITFSAKPTLVEFKGTNIVEKVKNCMLAAWGGNTNLEAVFDLLLDTAITNNTPAEDMPKKLYIISDMQFDAARGGYSAWDTKKPEPFMQKMKEKYIEAGYEMPIIIYWNVRASECGMFQDTFEGENCCMVSGYSPSLFKSIIEGTTYETEVVEDKNNGKIKVITKAKVNPMDVMIAAVYNERYDAVWCG